VFLLILLVFIGGGALYGFVTLSSAAQPRGTSIAINGKVVRKPTLRRVSGYVEVVLNLTVINLEHPDNLIEPNDLVLTDSYQNVYQYTYPSDVTPLALCGPTLTCTGNIMFVVPEAAINSDLRLSWRTGSFLKRIDLYVGPLPAPSDPLKATPAGPIG